jgi:hypothetical protein
MKLSPPAVHGVQDLLIKGRSRPPLAARLIPHTTRGAAHPAEPARPEVREEGALRLPRGATHRKWVTVAFKRGASMEPLLRRLSRPLRYEAVRARHVSNCKDGSAGRLARFANPPTSPPNPLREGLVGDTFVGMKER